ncbi:asparagine synthase (glutamine-hydrolyzing) [Longirhabdus pacifica]|uniref:asparagine synthase (glutamine-hydrolyzing) n=1 Tax=Longirhabdus pacifica TaxID=2305227 RepID=UPI001008CA62|nr:asparagine synthase (glutamine-hydrolyzing) [Longirhabdus pacifica]
MCGITGWVDWNKDLRHYPEIMQNMTNTLQLRGPDGEGVWLSNHCAFGHRRLSVIDPENGQQPMEVVNESHRYIITYNGELYNTHELRQALRCRGYTFRTQCDTEVLLCAYIEWGKACLDRFNGIFAFAIWDETKEICFMARDRLGVKPLFYSHLNHTLLFGSEPKAILSHPSFTPQIDKEGLCEVFIIGPARTPGHGVYKHMQEVLPGECVEFSRGGLRKYKYWKLESKTHEDNLEKTASVVQGMLEDTVERQLISDVPICTLLSGGLDSSALTTFAANKIHHQSNEKINTFSVDYLDNDKYFKSSSFQPNSDAKWIEMMYQFVGSQHHDIKLHTNELTEALDEAMYARDLPGMADIDASLYLFCKAIKKEATVALSGEAADEVFGGYPWFYREDALTANTFPWSIQLDHRLNWLSPDLIQTINPVRYLQQRYEGALSEVPKLLGETESQQRMRRMSYLNITRFMPTLLDRKDRMSMRASLEVRVPYCDHRLVQYVFNIPWDMKTVDNREKGMLRKALKGIMPEEVVTRKKSPYPKTHHPAYTEQVKKLLSNVVHDPNSPLLPLIDEKKIKSLLEQPAPTAIPWFGQLMSTPQLFAYLYQVDLWLRNYKVNIAV